MTPPDPLPRCPHGCKGHEHVDYVGYVSVHTSRADKCRCEVVAPTEAQARAAWHALCHASGWIACSERLPEHGKLVILADVDHACVGLGERTASGISFHGYAGEHEHPVATHWRAFPAPPQGEREASRD